VAHISWWQAVRVLSRPLGQKTSSQSHHQQGFGIARKDIVVRELKRAKPGVWGCIQAREVWSSEEEANMRPGHFWICKLGMFPGSMTCVERKFELQTRKRKWEEYKGTRYSDGDRVDFPMWIIEQDDL
jgi:hypothetical protein